MQPAAGGEYGGGVGLRSPGRYCANKGLAPGLERSAAGCEGNKLGLCRTLAKSLWGTNPLFSQELTLRTGLEFIDLPLENEAVLGTMA